MFPNQNYNDWSFQTPDFAEEQNQVENQNDWVDPAIAGLESMGPNVGHGSSGRTRARARARGRGRGRVRRSASSTDDAVNVAGNNNEDDEMRRTMHREVERQRRQDMSTLYSSLRNILPVDYIKGKRSSSDHVAEAVNYIKDLEKNVKDLADKRDQLRANNEWSTPNTYQGGESSNARACQGSVVINPCLGGLNIDIELGYEDESFSLSSALQVIFEEGLGVSSCTSNKFNERIVHNIVCEVHDISCIDFNRLQQRLLNLVY